MFLNSYYIGFCRKNSDIGEDIEGVVAKFQPQAKATIVPIHCEGSRSKLVQAGYDAFWHAVLKYLVKNRKLSRSEDN